MRKSIIPFFYFVLLTTSIVSAQNKESLSKVDTIEVELTGNFVSPPVITRLFFTQPKSQNVSAVGEVYSNELQKNQLSFFCRVANWQGCRFIQYPKYGQAG
jgi:hypothetical protein